MNEYKQQCTDFITWCRPKLNLHCKIHVQLVNKDIQVGQQVSFGYYDPRDHKIVISCKDRHPTDCLRTLAHELVHLAQAQISPLTGADGVTGSDIENEANALAGILMRLWNTKHIN
jgi:Zn-dependent peptidase ImmA (M78 family)